MNQTSLLKHQRQRILEYYTRIKNIEDKIKCKEKKLLHVDDKPILPVDILMTDEYLNTICYNEDHLKEYVKAMRFLSVKVKIVRVLWYLKNGKADFRKFLKIDYDDYVPFSIPMITCEDVTCKVNLRCFYEASDIEKVMKKNTLDIVNQWSVTANHCQPLPTTANHCRSNK